MQCVTVQLSLRWQTSLSMIITFWVYLSSPHSLLTLQPLILLHAQHASPPVHLLVSCIIFLPFFYFLYILLLWYSKIKSILLLLLLSP